MSENLILLSDSYKYSHAPQYPEKTEEVHSYFESRGGWAEETEFVGLQVLLDKYLAAPITRGDIAEAEELLAAHFGTPDLFNRAGWEYILDKHGGFLPVRIKAVPEGLSVPVHNVLMTVVNTDPKCFWLTNFLETLLSQVWYPTTVATLSREMKKLILRYLEQTGNPELIDFKLHDFGFRGVSSVESAGLGGMAHLTNFMGTDTVAALTYARKYYGAKMPGFSIPASEHSTITSWYQSGELDAYRNMVRTYGNYPLYACVSDSYDIYRACSQYWGEELKEEVLRAKGTLVVRPDSGIPHQVVVECLNRLGEAFEYTVNSKGFKVLNPKVRLIQGDGIDYEETRKILENMKTNGWSADNVAFGMGGGLLQKVNRDTQKFAFKCSSATVNGQERDVFKCPITDSGKISKKGKLSLLRDTRKRFITVPGADQKDDVLVEVFKDGSITRRWTWDEVRANAKIK